MKKLLVIAILAIAFASCTDNQRARNFGGKQIINLPKGRKLIEVTWKGESELWYLTRDRREDEKIETFRFQEKSSYGVMEGVVIFYEK